jgi:hypothetical protein
MDSFIFVLALIAAGTVAYFQRGEIFEWYHSGSVKGLEHGAENTTS